MKQETFTTIIIEAEEGKYLTQASSEIDAKDRITAKKVALGKNDSPSNWIEIEEEEAVAFEQSKYNVMESEAENV